MAFKKKLHTANPKTPPPPILTYRTRQRQKIESADPISLERKVRQMLSDKLSGTLLGLWLLVPEHLRLGTWDVLKSWAHGPARDLQARLALQVLHEAALCTTGIREHRCLCHKGFELANGLPFVATDQEIHALLDEHSVAEAIHLQRTLGRLRRASGHFRSRLLAIDPHRLHSYSKRTLVHLKSHDQHPAFKASQTFFCLDADTYQPVCFTIASSARSIFQATPELLDLASDILNPSPGQTLVVADCEHYVRELFAHVRAHSPFDLLCPMPRQRCYQDALKRTPAERFHSPWVGYAIAQQPFCFRDSPEIELTQLVQRTGEATPYAFKGFLATSPRDELFALTEAFPQRWHVEEFFHANQDLGWKRAGSLNLNVRFSQMTLALLAQTSLYQLRQRLGDPWRSCEAAPFAQKVLRGLDGDIRVHNDTIVVTYYNAPDAQRWREHFEALPDKLEAEHVDPRVPWLYNFKLDFRFK